MSSIEKPRQEEGGEHEATPVTRSESTEGHLPEESLRAATGEAEQLLAGIVADSEALASRVESAGLTGNSEAQQALREATLQFDQFQQAVRGKLTLLALAASALFSQPVFAKIETVDALQDGVVAAAMNVASSVENDSPSAGAFLHREQEAEVPIRDEVTQEELEVSPVAGTGSTPESAEDKEFREAVERIAYACFTNGNGECLKEVVDFTTSRQLLENIAPFREGYSLMKQNIQDESLGTKDRILGVLKGAGKFLGDFGLLVSSAGILQFARVYREIDLVVSRGKGMVKYYKENKQNIAVLLDIMFPDAEKRAAIQARIDAEAKTGG